LGTLVLGMNIKGLIGAALFIIGLVVGLAGVKTGASPLVIFGLVLILVGLAIPNWMGK
jgi:hypothetical protein